MLTIDTDRDSLIEQPRYPEIERVAPDIANIIAEFVGSNGRQLVGLDHLDFIDKHRLLLTPLSVANVSVLRIDDENNAPGDLPRTTLIVLPTLPLLLGPLPIFTTDAIATRSSRYASAEESHLRTSRLFQRSTYFPSLYLVSASLWKRPGAAWPAGISGCNGQPAQVAIISSRYPEY
jgi:hypothetical protein